MFNAARIGKCPQRSDDEPGWWLGAAHCINTPYQSTTMCTINTLGAVVIYGKFQTQVSHATARNHLRGVRVRERYARNPGVPTLPALLRSPKPSFPT